MATFGSSGTGNTLRTDLSDQTLLGKFTLSENGSVSKLSVYLSNQAVGHKAGYAKAIIYADSGGVPGALSGIGPATAISDNVALGWIDFSFSTPVELVAGTYWIGLHGNSGASSTGGVAVRYDNASGNCEVGWDNYADGPEDPFNAADDVTFTGVLSCYATYTQGGILRHNFMMMGVGTA